MLSFLNEANAPDLVHIFLNLSVSSHTFRILSVCTGVHAGDYGCDNGWLVTEGDNYYVDDGTDECFTVMMMIITVVVLVLHPSVID